MGSLASLAWVAGRWPTILRADERLQSGYREPDAPGPPSSTTETLGRALRGLRSSC